MAFAVKLTSLSTKHLGQVAKRFAANKTIQNQFHTVQRNLPQTKNALLTVRENHAAKPKRWFRTKRDDGASRRSLAPVEELEGPDAGYRNLLKPFGFMVLVSGGSYAACSVWQYETFRSQIKNRGNNDRAFYYGKAGDFRDRLNATWNSFSGGQKLMAGVIGTNVLVFLLWRVAPQRLMLKYFTSSPLSGAPSLSLLLSSFSHFSLLHLAANMYVLWSFTRPAAEMFGKEQLMATYISAGLVSGFASYIYKVFRRSHNPSVGASGAIMALLGAVCTQHPDSRLSIAFVDQIYPHSFSANTAMKFIIGMDAMGCILGWRFFDHAGHLGGMLFGMWYVTYGHKLIWGNRERFVKWWHKTRGDPGS